MSKVAALQILLAFPVFASGYTANAERVDMPVRKIDPTSFSEDALIQVPETVPCSLENGATTECAKLVVKYLPDDLAIGPFCPTRLDEPGGIWDWSGKKAGLYRVDEPFLRMLDGLGYTFFDTDGEVYLSNIFTAPVHDHTCIAVSLDDTVEMTVLLPVRPVMAEAPTLLRVVSKVGLALNGVPIFADAPPIQVTGHMPVLDTCGGHVDPGGWYHWHATATDIETVFDREHVEADCRLEQDASGLFGYAFDGLPLYGSADMDGTIPDDLDACNGHVGPTSDDPEGSYHYHASVEFPNLPPCLVGVQAIDNFTTTAQIGVGAEPPEGQVITRINPPRPGGPGGRPGGGPGRPPPGFDEAAAKLGVSEDALMRAVRDAGGPRLDFAAAAEALGVSETDLRDALPPPPRR